MSEATRINRGEYVDVENGNFYAGAYRVTIVSGTDGDNQIRLSSMYGLIDGKAGDDVLSGSHYGSDIIRGGLGHDVLDGSYMPASPPWWGDWRGRDRFDFRDPAESTVGVDRDVIRNFQQIDRFGDQVNLGYMDANDSIRGNQAFVFISDADFSGTAGELRVEYVDFADDTLDYNLISGDVNGDGLADFEIEVHMQSANRYLSAPNDIIL